MAKLPPEEELEPTHTLGGELTDDDVPMPDLDDYDSEPEPLEDSQDEDLPVDDYMEGAEDDE